MTMKFKYNNYVISSKTVQLMNRRTMIMTLNKMKKIKIAKVPRFLQILTIFRSNINYMNKNKEKILYL